MKQPEIYNNLQELIDWLKYDLDEQREEIAKDRGISLNDVKDEELVLHIGNKNSDCDIINYLNQQYTTFNICFDFKHILKGIDNNKNILIKNNKYYRVCKYRINARHCIFNLDVSTFNVIFEQEVNFFNSEFKNNKESFFLNCDFENNLIFSNCSFYNNFAFYNCSFFSEVNFNDSKLYSDIGFNGGNINDKINFNNSFIKGKLVMNGNKIENTISINLDNISFENSKSLLSIKDMTNTIESVSLKDIYMNGRINFYNIKVKNINLQGTNIIGDFSDINCEYDNLSNWQTARILKHEEYKKSNSIKALEYHAEETKLYKEYLSEEIKKKFNIKKFGDILSISLSSLYSNNGLNWIKSIFMTILITFIFFNIFYSPDLFKSNIELSYYKYYYKDYLYRLAEYFIPTDYNHLVEYLKNSNVCVFIKICGIIVYFTGKIMFWYGSVQTVQSFRKFSKKE